MTSARSALRSATIDNHRGVAGAVLCLPTYDERENLARMVDVIASVRATTGDDLDVLVIDDGSPDGTGEIADELAATRPWLHVLHRTQKEGLGRAYLAGFALGARTRLRPGARDGLRLLARPRRGSRRCATAVANGADLALGSRYVAGGGVRDWGLARRVISRGGCLYARLILQLPVHDLTGGFKCFDRRVLETIALAEVRAEGLRLPDRDDVPRAAARLRRGRGADHLRRPRRGRIEDVAADRGGGCLARAAAPVARPARPDSAPPMRRMPRYAVSCRHACDGGGSRSGPAQS